MVLTRFKSVLHCLVLLGAVLCLAGLFDATGGFARAAFAAETISLSAPKYSRFEAQVALPANTVATDLYLPYDPAPPGGVTPGTGVSVDALLLAPGRVNWSEAKVQPCYFAGTGGWRIRFAPDVEGVWQYKIRLRDAARPGGVEGGVQQFTCTPATSHGFVRVSPTDGRFFEFSDGTPFVHSLVSGEDNMFANRDAWETQMAKFNQAGVRFFRFWLQVWGSNFLFPWGGRAQYEEYFHNGPKSTLKQWITVDQNEAAATDRLFTLMDRNNLYVRLVLLEKHDKILNSLAGGFYGGPDTAAGWYKQAWWRYFIARYSAFRAVHSLENVNEDDPFSGPARTAAYHFADYMNRNSPRPLLPGTSFWHSFVASFWRDSRIGYAGLHEYIGNSYTGDIYWWGLASRKPSPVWYASTDRTIEVANGDGLNGSRSLRAKIGATGRTVHEIAYFGGVPGKSYRLKVWMKAVNAQNNPLNTYEGTTISLFATKGYTASNDTADGGWQPGVNLRGVVPPMFSSEKVTRDWQEYVADMTMSPYKDMLGLRLDLIGAPDMTLWYDNIRVYELDDAGQERLIWRMSFDEPLITQDSALNTRAYWMKFDAFRLNKPVVRGETGLPPDNTGFDRHEDPNLTADQLRVFHHKRIWAHLGSPGFYDGYLWWPRIEAHNLWPLWGAYERFMTGEPVSNGKYTEIGSDLEGLRQVNVTGGVRAWGLRDAAAGKVLLWIDNPDQTFRNLNPGSRSGTVSTGGWANGTYTVEWWDTSKGVKVSSYDTQVQNGVLALSFSGLQGDVAAKIYPAALAPTPPPTAPTPPPTAPETGTGLRAEYFGWYDWDTQTYSRPVFVRTDATINFNWGLGSPGTGIGSDKFAVVWTGKVLPRYSETYSFTSTTDDGVRVWVNGKLIIDQWGHSRPGRTFSGNIALTAGQKYDIKMEYYEDSVDAVARLEWQSPSQAREVVPQSQLFPQ